MLPGEGLLTNQPLHPALAFANAACTAAFARPASDMPAAVPSTLPPPGCIGRGDVGDPGLLRPAATAAIAIALGDVAGLPNPAAAAAIALGDPGPDVAAPPCP